MLFLFTNTTSDDVKTLSPELEVLDIKDFENQCIITIKSTNIDAKCSLFGTVSNNVHQKYTKLICCKNFLTFTIIYNIIVYMR